MVLTMTMWKPIIRLQKGETLRLWEDTQKKKLAVKTPM